MCASLIKKYVLMLSFVVLVSSAFAQQNAIKIHSGNILPSRFKVQYERRLSDKFSVGAIGSLFINNFRGYRIEPFGRFYVGGESVVFDGMFVQVKGHYTYVTDNSPMKELTKEYGASLCVGYQRTFSSGITAEVFLGSRSSSKAYKNVSESAEMFNVLYCLPVDLGLSLGYAF